MTTATQTNQPEGGAGASSSEDGPFRILVADTLETSCIDRFEASGCIVTVAPELKPDTLPDAMQEHDPDALIVRSTKVPEPVFERAGRLSLIVRAGAGYDNIDVAAASRHGVFVANCPGRNAIAVAELAWGLILSCDRRIPDQTAALRDGTWDKKGFGKARGLYGSTLGLVGLGRIGREVAARGRAFGMRVIAWSRSLTQETADELGIGYCSSLINLAKMSDVVSLHVAATDETRQLIDGTFLQAMKQGATLVNTARGSVIDNDALIEAIRTRGLRAGLDVYALQPGPGDKVFSDPVIKEPLVYGTHHSGASTDQAQQAVADAVVAIIDRYREHGEVMHCVNRAASTPATSLLTVRHLNRPGVLAHVFYTLGQAGLNVEEMENIIYDGYEAACAKIQIDGSPSEEHLRAIGANEHVLSINVTRLEYAGT
jgi:D-3-phosphoglycerate dehydrogenase